MTASASANCSTAIGDLARTLGPAKITLGSDYPFPLGEPQSGQLIRSRPFGDDTKARLPGQNALDWLGRPAERFGG